VLAAEPVAATRQLSSSASQPGEPPSGSDLLRYLAVALIAAVAVTAGAVARQAQRNS
jgi:hypothetical protein